jgi:hypothetical protein
MPMQIPAGILFPTGTGSPEHPIAPGGPGGYPSHPIAGGGGHPSHPIALPPLPGVWPPPGQPSLPIYIPPEVAIPPYPQPPIAIEPPPDKPNPIPPGEIWPDLPPEYAGKVVAVIVLGEGKVHWYHVPPPAVNPPVARPK